MVVCETPGELRTGDVVPTRDWTTRLTFVSCITGVLSLYTFIRSLHCQLILIGLFTSEQFQLLNIATINGLNIATITKLHKVEIGRLTSSVTETRLVRLVRLKASERGVARVLNTVYNYVGTVDRLVSCSCRVDGLIAGMR